MNILSVTTNKKNFATNYSVFGFDPYIIQAFRQELINLNTTFSNEVVYKIIKIVDEKKLFEIKDKARMFQEEIFYMIDLLIQLNNRCDLLHKNLETYFTDGQANLFTEVNTEELKKLPKMEKSFYGLYSEIKDKLKSYESFVKKAVKLADKIQKKYKKQQYKKEIQTDNKPLNIKDDFKGLEDKTLLQYFKQYERISKKYNTITEKTEGVSLPNGEDDLVMNLGLINIMSNYHTTQENLSKLEDFYYKPFLEIFTEQAKKFKKGVLELNKNVNGFNEIINSFQKTK